MSEDRDFDAIIVGGGLAGLSAGIVLANAGLGVMLVERGDECGMKNMTGGRLYGHSLEKIIPGFAEEAPIERKVTHEKISLMNEKGSLDIGFNSLKLKDAEEEASYTVLRAKFDSWLASKAEEAGVEMVTGIRVDTCLVDENGAVYGIEADGDEITSDVVILA
ncbi:MAG: FAD-dependent oxidoreductase, partial [Lachnospiraceae bacterium]|nr:FAD-dependent oxidoreductase [Lachnospiraceae bacterium]